MRRSVAGEALDAGVSLKPPPPAAAAAAAVEVCPGVGLTGAST